jgi:nicotinamidase-related amidase
MTTRALVVVDVQNEYFGGPLEIQYPPREDSLANIVRVIEHANSRGLPVIAVQHTAPADFPVFAHGSDSWALHPKVAGLATADWKHVTKHYGSVFAGTDVAEWLTEHGIDTITVVGYMTNNCDIATAADAEARGFATEVLSDATGAIHLTNDAGSVPAKQLHESLMVLLNSNFAAVATTDRWLEAAEAKEPLAKSNLVESALQGRQTQG